MNLRSFGCLLLLLGFPLAGLPAEELRWTTVEGHKLRAAFAGISGDRVGLLVDGKVLPVPLQRLSPSSQEQARGLAPSAAPSAPVQGSPRWHFFDEASKRLVAIQETAPGEVDVVVFAANGGSVYRWTGRGGRFPAAPAAPDRPAKAKTGSTLSFSQVVGEGGERGTLFTGIENPSGSELEIRFAEGEREPQDAGINGLYERISADKALSWAKKQVKISSAELDDVLRSAPRNWSGPNRRASKEWEDRWPTLRTHWVELVFPPAAFAVPGDTRALEPHLDYWLAQLEAIGMGWGWIAYAVFDQPAVDAWDGEYDDAFGGHVSLRSGAAGSFTFNLGGFRGRIDDLHSAELAGRIEGTNVRQESGGVLSASYTHPPAGLPEGTPPLQLSFRKFGHFLVVQSANASPYTGAVWFEGVYRWYPVPIE